MFADPYEDPYHYESEFDSDAMLDVPFVPSDEKVVHKMLEMAGVHEDDLLYDLGCGDGRIVVAAAKEYGARAVGVDLDPRRLEEAREYAELTGVGRQVAFIEDDLLDVDFSRASVVCLYLLGTINLELRPRLLSELEPGTRIVSNTFDMAYWKPDEQATARDTRIFLWTVPASVAGSWQWQTRDGRDYRVRLTQTHQRLRGQAWIEGRPARLKSAEIRGTQLKLTIRENEAGPARTFLSRYRDGRLLPNSGSAQATAAVRLVERRPASCSRAWSP